MGTREYPGFLSQAYFAQFGRYGDSEVLNGLPTGLADLHFRLLRRPLRRTRAILRILYTEKEPTPGSILEIIEQ
jgi:hypothetical protein